MFLNPMLGDDGTRVKIIFLTRFPFSAFQFVCIDRLGSFESVRWLLYVNQIILNAYNAVGESINYFSTSGNSCCVSV